MFLTEFGNITVQCNATQGIIWNDQVCDGVDDCEDGQDEDGCTRCT